MGSFFLLLRPHDSLNAGSSPQTLLEALPDYFYALLFTLKTRVTSGEEGKEGKSERVQVRARKQKEGILPLFFLFAYLSPSSLFPVSSIAWRTRVGVQSTPYLVPGEAEPAP